MANTYGKVSGTFQEIDNAYGKVSGAWQEADEIYGKVSGVWKLVFAAFQAASVQTLSSGSGTFSVPQGANAIHIQAVLEVEVELLRGDYDKAGGESAGAGGGSGAYVSDKVFSVTQGETLTYAIGVVVQRVIKVINIMYLEVLEQVQLIWIKCRINIYVRWRWRLKWSGGSVQGPLRIKQCRVREVC